MQKLLVLYLCMLPVYALASGDPTPQFINDHGELFFWLLAMALLGLGFLIARLIGTMDKNNENQWKAINELSNRVYSLEGEHKAIHGKGGRRSYDPVEREG